MSASFIELAVKCVICKSPLIEHKWETHEQVGPMIIGPGNRTALRRHSEIYCETCGIAYRHLPKVTP